MPFFSFFHMHPSCFLQLFNFLNILWSPAFSIEICLTPRPPHCSFLASLWPRVSTTVPKPSRLCWLVLTFYNLASIRTHFFFNFILFLNFTILYWFCQISKWIHHKYTCGQIKSYKTILALGTESGSKACLLIQWLTGACLNSQPSQPLHPPAWDSLSDVWWQARGTTVYGL